nr:uncharacterized protein LOC123280855 isoform X2 [Equus asinus]
MGNQDCGFLEDTGYVLVILNLYCLALYLELERNNKAAIKITQHKKVYKRKKYFVLKSLLHVIIFATVRLSTDASSTEMAKKKKTKQSKIKP